MFLESLFSFSQPHQGMAYVLGEYLLYSERPCEMTRFADLQLKAYPLRQHFFSGLGHGRGDPEGKIKGHTIIPIYPSAPNAAKHDVKLYELLSLVDALRVGRAREKKIAREELEKRFHA